MKKLALYLAMLVLTACQSPPPPPTASPARARPAVATGIDLPIDTRDVAMELRGSHLDFVARYYRDPASRWPTLSAAEARTLSAAGMRLVAVFESHSHRADYFNYAAGFADGMNAYGQARAIGQPAGSAIYFAVDFNAQEADLWGGVDRYFRGVLNGFWASAGGQAPDYKIGVYGSGAVCEYLKHAHLAQYTWLSNSTAWTGYDNFTDWDIRQSGRSPLLSFDQDQNEARGEFGSFQVSTQVSSL